MFHRSKKYFKQSSLYFYMSVFKWSCAQCVLCNTGKSWSFLRTQFSKFWKIKWFIRINFCESYKIQFFAGNSISGSKSTFVKFPKFSLPNFFIENLLDVDLSFNLIRMALLLKNNNYLNYREQPALYAKGTVQHLTYCFI